MAVKVTITFEGLQETLERLSEIGEKAEHNVETIMKDLGDDTEQHWKENTPVGKTGRLSGDEKVMPMGLTFTLTSPTHYYKWVDEGHNTPKGWRTKHGYRPAKHISHVEGREMTKKATDFVEQNLERRLSKFLDNV